MNANEAAKLKESITAEYSAKIGALRTQLNYFERKMNDELAAVDMVYRRLRASPSLFPGGDAKKVLPPNIAILRKHRKGESVASLMIRAAGEIGGRFDTKTLFQRTRSMRPDGDIVDNTLNSNFSRLKKKGVFEALKEAYGTSPGIYKLSGL